MAQGRQFSIVVLERAGPQFEVRERGLDCKDSKLLWVHSARQASDKTHCQA